MGNMSKRICAGILGVVIKEVRLSRLGRLGAIERVVRGFESGKGCCPKTRMSEYVKKRGVGAKQGGWGGSLKKKCST